MALLLTWMPKSTVGPSEESPEAITMIGKAAHICAAAPGGRRYIPPPAMTSDQRKDIDNAIWLCADHADLIDRDETLYTIDSLKEMKREHEAHQAKLLRTGASRDLGAGLVGVGPDVVFMGDIERVSETSWTTLIKHFVLGEHYQLVDLIDRFSQIGEEDRYILSNELGLGRSLSASPILLKSDGKYKLECSIEPAFPRTDVHKIGSSYAIDPDTNDMFVDSKGNIARVSGEDYLPQKIRNCLSVQRGEDSFSPGYGVRFFDFFDEFKGSPWISSLMKLDAIRMACIPHTDDVLKKQYTPMLCVNRVRELELLSDHPTGNYLPISLDLDVEGLGRWKQETKIFMPTSDQMSKRREYVASRRFHT